MSEIIKNKTYVSIAGREYGIVSGESTEYIQKIAIELDSRICQLADAYFSLTNLDVTTLAALNIMDDYVKTKEELERISSEIDVLRSALRDMQIKLHQGHSEKQGSAEMSALKREVDMLRKENAALKASNHSKGYEVIAK